MLEQRITGVKCSSHSCDSCNSAVPQFVALAGISPAGNRTGDDASLWWRCFARQRTGL